MEKKFRLTGKESILVLNAPDSFPIQSTVHKAPYQRILTFVYTLEDMVQAVKQAIEQEQLEESGYLFLLYPKKNNKQFDTYIARDDIFPAFDIDEEKYVFGSAIKFNSLQSLDETYSILSLKKQTKKVKKQAASQCVDDYIDRIPALEKFLGTAPEALGRYQALTPGYKKDWARYVYSAKKEETQEQRLHEMVMILNAGYKTKDLYRQGKK